MRFDQLKDVLRKRPGSYFLWSAGNLGGILIAYLASLTLWINQGVVSTYLPGPEAFLITATISLAMAGVSCVSVKSLSNVSLSPIITGSWPFVVMLIYGQLIALGAKNEIAPSQKSWVIAIALFVLSFIWSSVTWLHEQGVRIDIDQEVKITEGPPPELTQTAQGLPKVPPAPGTERN